MAGISAPVLSLNFVLMALVCCANCLDTGLSRADAVFVVRVNMRNNASLDLQNDAQRILARIIYNARGPIVK